MTSTQPWYRTVRRWGQTNLNELDPTNHDGEWWRDYWRRTHTQGVIINAGGIVAYYPSALPLHYRAEHLGDRDLYGEINAAAREEGLAVLARMDSNRATEAFYREHRDWFYMDAEGRPSVTQGRYQACVNTPFYKEFIPDVLREVIDCYRPDGFTDNSWTGVGRNHICHCPWCRTKFASEVGGDLPVRVDWADPAYREWVRWSYACRIENWELNNRVTQGAGGPDCLWLGMINGDPLSSHLSFCDLKAVGERSRIMMSDQQSRRDTGFEYNAISGQLLHGVMGWDAQIPESMATYVRGPQAFRKAANPPLETRHWMIEGYAGGISPWWHHIGAFQEDRRQFETVLPLMRWHADNESLLYDREPVATVGVLWSHENIDFYGRDKADERVLLPWHGWTRALTRARIPFIPVHADHIAREAPRLKALVLPDLGVLTDGQVEALRAFVASGGSLVASGLSGWLDAWGEPRPTPALGELLGITYAGERLGLTGAHSSNWEVQSGHTYLRLDPEPRSRHPLVAGFEGTDILAFGGTLQRVSLAAEARPVATYVPAFPIYPPEFSWMRQSHSDIPAIVAREHPAGGRIVYLAADIDRVYGARRLPDHGRLLANAARWAAGELPLHVEGLGAIDCHLYRQGERLILHLVNLSGASEWPAYLGEHLPVGPLTVSVRWPGDKDVRARCCVEPSVLPVMQKDGQATVTLDGLVDHQVIVFE
ncbi:MAG: Tat pathway signal protein [Anaerolineae bacterium]